MIVYINCDDYLFYYFIVFFSSTQKCSINELSMTHMCKQFNYVLHCIWLSFPEKVNGSLEPFIVMLNINCDDSGLQIRVRIGKLFSLILIQNICCGYSKEPSQ